MTLEFLLWLIAWFVVSEILFIVWYILDEGYTPWGLIKFFSFSFGVFFILFQNVIVFCDGSGTFTTPNYIHLLYEAIVIGIIAFLFGINKLIISLINNVDKKKVKK